MTVSVVYSPGEQYRPASQSLLTQLLSHGESHHGSFSARSFDLVQYYLGPV